MLGEGLTRFGAARGSAQIDVTLPVAPGEELHIWNRPARAVYLGQGSRPLKRGVGFEETELHPGDVIEWAGLSLTYRSGAPEPGSATLEELPMDPPAGTTPARGPEAGGPPPEGERIWRRLVAGLLVELDLTDRSLVKRWQKRVVEGGFQVEDCARELYEAGRLDESRLLDRSGRLLRDFLMAPLTRGARGAGRKVRMATKRGVAWVVAQFVVVAIYTVILVLIMAFLYRGGTRFDPLFEWLMPGG